MTTQSYTLEITDWQSACEDLYAVRRSVFIDEQGVPPALEQDESDADCWHVLARDSAGTPIATGRLLRDGHIGRVAVLEPWRGRGLGRAVMRRLLELAREQGLREVVLNAQFEAQSFYRKLGFRAEGKQFLEAGIPHRAMRLRLGQETDEGKLRARELGGVKDSLSAAICLIDNTRRYLIVYTPYIHPGLYGADELSEALVRRISDQPRIQCRLLLPSVASWRRDCPQLVKLVQRLSALQLRHLSRDETRERAEFSQAFMLADDSKLLLWQDPRTCTGRCTPSGGPDARRLSGFFNDYWERGIPDTELRQLGL